jgi:hypothetical protein
MSSNNNVKFERYGMIKLEQHWEIKWLVLLLIFFYFLQ